MSDKAPPMPPRSRAPSGQGRTLSSLAGPLIRALHQVDSACMRVLSQSYSDNDKACARLEVSMWLPLHRALVSHLGGAPAQEDNSRIDALLADDLLAFVDDVLLWVADVEAGGGRRTARYLASCRQRLGELEAFGGHVGPLRQKLSDLQSRHKASGTLDEALALAQLHGTIAAALEGQAPRTAVSLMDSLAR